MATSTTDIGNRALQLLGTRTTMASLTESSNEAQQVSIAFVPIQNWCSGLANWNFARSIAVLSMLKSTGTPSGAWSSTKPAPPWLFEYSLPSDFVRALYVTNSTIKPDNTAYLGEPQRFVLAVDTISTVQQEVLLTNQSAAILIYTAFVANPTVWPWYFERLMVTALATTLCMPLTGNLKLLTELSADLEQHINISIQANLAEGLQVQDNTPEWIQASGINYPYRRFSDPTPAMRPRPMPKDPQQ